MGGRQNWQRHSKWGTAREIRRFVAPPERMLRRNHARRRRRFAIRGGGRRGFRPPLRRRERVLVGIHHGAGYQPCHSALVTSTLNPPPSIGGPISAQSFTTCLSSR